MGRPRKAKAPLPQFEVIRDSSEKKGHGWLFEESPECRGTVVENLNTGDYTLRGWESSFVIERKHSTAEIAQNIYEKRFEAELERLEQFRHAFVVCEFSVESLRIFPAGSGIPQSRWKYLRTTPEYLQKRLLDFQCRYRTKWLFAGAFARDWAFSLFKWVFANVPPTTASSI